MFTVDKIDDEIRDIVAGPVTAPAVSLLASMLYIKRHGKELLAALEPGLKNDGDAFTQEMAMEWTAQMQNADGTNGPHWTIDKTEDARVQRGIDCDPLTFYVAVNMMYSDYCKVASKVNENNMDFYAYMAKAFLDDKDAKNQGKKKLAQYYKYVVL